MKKINSLVLGATMAASLMSVSGASVAGVSANVGFVSDYYFRGVYQASSSASAGLDYEHESEMWERV